MTEVTTLPCRSPPPGMPGGGYARTSGPLWNAYARSPGGSSPATRSGRICSAAARSTTLQTGGPIRHRRPCSPGRVRAAGQLVRPPHPRAGQMPMLQVALNWWQPLPPGLPPGPRRNAAHYAYQRPGFPPHPGWKPAGTPPWYGMPSTRTHLITSSPGWPRAGGRHRRRGWPPLGRPRRACHPARRTHVRHDRRADPVAEPSGRRDHRPGRLSVMYFVNPPFKGRVAPYVGGRADIVDLALTRCTTFGQQVPADLLP